jgi:NADH-quinone oxidoreductase subunit C
VNVEELAERLRPGSGDVVVARGEATLVVEPGDLRETLAFLRDQPDLAFDVLLSVTATDWPDQYPRFWVVYELLSTTHRHRLRMKVGVDERDPRVDSATPIHPGANWHERETFDFYGIAFDGHPDLSRILLPDDWEGYPLRKTESLGGVNTRYHGAFIPPIDERTS